jgi:hypothetical protein
MRAKQVSVFAENRPGRLQDLLRALKDAKVSIRALSIADSADFGIVRMIFSDTETAELALRRAGFTLMVNEVLAVEVSDAAGGLLDRIVDPLTKAGLNIEYVYAYADRPAEHALVVLKTGDIVAAEKVLGL